MKTVEDILLCGDNLEIGSDSDISDASQISPAHYPYLVLLKPTWLIRRIGPIFYIHDNSKAGEIRLA